MAALDVFALPLGSETGLEITRRASALPGGRRAPARRSGITLALVLRLVLLSAIAFIVSLTKPVVVLPFAIPSLAAGHPMVDLAFSWRDLLLLAGGLFLVWK